MIDTQGISLYSNEMRIIFHSNQISIRGTEIAIYDYALGNINILKGESYIAAPLGNVQDQSVLEKFENKFLVKLYKDKKDLEDFIKKNDIDIIYQITAGSKEDLLTDIVPTFLHCVFTTKYKYSKLYIPISQFLNNYYKTNYPVLPHIVRKFPGLTDDLREELNIPKNALVFGGYGGRKQFDLDFVKNTIIDITTKKNNIYFIFLNFKEFINNKNVIFLPKNSDIEYKERFINSCDAMIHGRSDGETFGLSIAEFSIKNKPIITWKPKISKNIKFMIKTYIRYARNKKHMYASAHLDFLGKNAITYSNKKDLFKILTNFQKEDYISKNNDFYSDRFSEEKVMKKFDEIIRSQINLQ